MLSLISNLVIPLKSTDENPGVSAIKLPSISYKVTHLVVCFPLPRAFDISLVCKSRFLSNLFRREDLPAPDCPANTTVFPSINFFILFFSVFATTS